jgi:non-specific serine/threonine protein kinase
MKDVFEVQDEIAQSIARALEVMLTEKEKAAIQKTPTDNVQAYDYYLRGRGYARRETRPDLEFSMQMFEQAISLDAGFALAHAAVADACATMYEIHEKQPGWIEKGLAACERALALEAQLPEALVSRARLAYAQKNFSEAVQLARMAIERKHNCPGAYNILGRALFASDRWQEAADLFDKAIEANGDDYNMYIAFMNVLECLGRSEEAKRVRRMELQILRQQLELTPDNVRARILLAADLAALGEHNEAMRELERSVAMRPNDANILYNAACTYGVMGKKAEALDLARRTIEAGYTNTPWMARDPDLACLHDDPEFQQLCASGSPKA